MTDISFSTPASLHLAQHSSDPQAPQGRRLDHGSLGRMVGRVMNAAADQRWHFAIFADGGPYLHAAEIEALAGTRKYADWSAGQA